MTSAVSLGFLTVLQEGGSHVGGYLVTNTWGRPLEFRLSTAVQPTRAHQILYGPTLRPYICADLIGKTLVEKSAIPPQLVLTDNGFALDLRSRLEVPVVWVMTAEDEIPPEASVVLPASASRGPVVCHPRYPQDVAAAGEILAGLEGLIDLAEPFARVREAMTEARKMGVSGRAA
jgi:hypothetical protein